MTGLRVLVTAGSLASDVPRSAPWLVDGDEPDRRQARHGDVDGIRLVVPALLPGLDDDAGAARGVGVVAGGVEDDRPPARPGAPIR